MSAFALTVESGAPAVEFDVKLTADGHVVIVHDVSVDRTTDGIGNVHELPLSTIKELDAGQFFSDKFKGEQIPTLEDVFAAFGSKLYMNVELTNYRTPKDDLVEKVIKLVRYHNLHDKVLLSSFFAKNLQKAARLEPSIQRGLLAFEGWMGVIARSSWAIRGPYHAIHPNLKDINAKLVNRAHRYGRRVNVWTVNDPADIRQVQALGVDGIFTDDPGLAIRILRGQE